MKLGLTVSSVAHAGILAFALISLPAPEKYDTSSFESLPVEVFSVEEYSNLRKGEKTAEEVKPEPVVATPEAKPEPEAKPVQQEEVAAVQPDPQVKPAPEVTPEPVPVPEPPKVEEPAPQPEPQQAAEPEPKPEAAPAPEPEKQVADLPVRLPIARPRDIPKRPKPKEEEPKKEEFSPDSITALLNKETDQNQTRSEGEGAGSQVASLGARSGTGSGLSQSELDFLRGQISRCWSPPVGAADPSQLVVRVQMALNPDGSVVGAQILEFKASPIGKAAADSALRAVRRCQPYTLPPDRYDTWKTVNINFDPRDMLN